jgi:DNA-binding beta-propeller fold protein YncE
VPTLVALPPHAVPIRSGFDYVTVDARRARVYAAHSESKTLLVADGKTGEVLGQVDVGPMHGVAVDPADGMVYTGNGTDQTISKVDPVAMKVVSSVNVPGNIDGMEYDPQLHRLYADEDGANHVFVVDTRAMKLIGTVTLPSRDPEAIGIDPTTHRVYQNLNDSDSIAVIDPRALKVVQIIKTPQLQHNHPLVFDAPLNELVVGGKNGVMSTYAPDGTHRLDGTVQPNIDQCDLGQNGDVEACAGEGVVTLVRLRVGLAPRIVAVYKAPKGTHTVGIDEPHHRVWIVYPTQSGDFIEALRIEP